MDFSKRNFKTTSLAAGILLATAVSASAAVIDFTSNATLLSGGNIDGVSWGVVGTPVAPNNNQGFDGGSAPSNAFGLAFENDGWGIADDEISNGDQVVESITINFGSSVSILGFGFLDLFEEGDSGLGEVGIMTANGVDYELSFDAANSSFGGYAESLFGAPIITDSVTFTAARTNDGAGFADGALAALEVAPVPLPAAGFLMFGAIGGLAALRRRRKAA